MLKFRWWLSVMVNILVWKLSYAGPGYYSDGRLSANR